MFCTSIGFAVVGIEAVMVRVEADVSPGLPSFDMVGYLSSEVKEARERVRVSMKNSGYALPPKKITVNLSPGDLRKEGTSYDLSIALALLGGLGFLPPDLLKDVGILGELSLDGKVLGVPGVLSAVSEAKNIGLRKMLVPGKNLAEASLITGIELIGVESLTEALESLVGCYPSEAAVTPNAAEDILNVDVSISDTKASVLDVDAGISDIEAAISDYEEMSEDKDVLEKTVRHDFADIHGQFLAKRGAEICAAGKHNLLLMGPPGTGKSMLARCIPGILPKLTVSERLELTKIYSVAGILQEGGKLLSERPFRAPHHTISGTALIGGGVIPKPGEISLACHGVLFLDEFTEFQRASIEVLRQPLEEKKVRITRLHGATSFPANVSLVAAMNPCPCGYYPNREKCHCSPDRIRRYLGKISQPILDRIDLCVELSSLSFGEMLETEKAESSADIQKRVEQAVEIQKKRYEGLGFTFNSELPASLLETYCPLDEACKAVLEKAYSGNNFSARGYHRMVRVARTIADLEGCEQIQVRHVKEAYRYHTPDRGYMEVS